MYAFNEPILHAAAALQRLRQGNRRFVEDRCVAHGLASNQRKALARRQTPFAIILGCSDSRVPAELVFDQGLGDLFVIRVAGNIVAPSQIGSVEFAAATFGTHLAVVMGHSECGVIRAAVDALGTGRKTESGLKPGLKPKLKKGLESPSLSTIVDRVTPNLSPLMEMYPEDDQALVAAATRANVLASVDQLRSGSDILDGLVSDGQLRIVGAHCSLETGVVEFYS